MHKVLVNRLGGLSLPRKSVVRLTDRPDMTFDVYCGRKTTTNLACMVVEKSLTKNFSIHSMEEKKLGQIQGRISRRRLGPVAQWVGHLTHKSGVLGSIPSLATYFRFSFRFFKKGSCQLLAKVCVQSTG